MAQCKYCHQQITRVDKDFCPFCGGARPLDGTDTTTQDITKVVGSIEHPVEIKHKKRLITAIFAFLLGFLGVHEFYLGKIKKALITLAISIGLIFCIGLILFFAVGWHSPFAFLIPYFLIEAFMIFVGIGYLTRHDVTDSNGEFLD